MTTTRKKWPLVLLLIVAAVSAAIWFGGDWLWHLLLRMHGVHAG